MTDGPEDFFRRLEESGMLNDSIVEQRDRVLSAGSADEAASELVRQNLLTDLQSEVPDHLCPWHVRTDKN